MSTVLQYREDSHRFVYMDHIHEHAAESAASGTGGSVGDHHDVGDQVLYEKGLVCRRGRST